MTNATTHGLVSVQHLSKSFGTVRAVDDLTFEIGPGRVTGFLGPNGAGKTTTLRMLLGLVAPTSGTATIDGRRYADIPQPGRVVGAALEASSFHPGRTARDHLRVLAPQVGVSTKRCDEVLELVGLKDAARRRAGGFSLGMRQRLGLAATLLGDPKVLLLDEPANGLDPQGIAWLRSLLRYLAAEGRTILVSSHVLSEVAQTVDDVIIIAKGRLVHASSLADLEALARREGLARRTTVLASPDVEGIARLAESRWPGRATPITGRPGAYVLQDVDAAEAGAAAFAAGLEVHELVPGEVNLEEVFLRLTGVDTAAPTAPGVAA